MDKKDFGNQVKKIRRNLNLTQIDITAKIGISPETLRRIENGIHNVSISTIELLSNFYKVDLLKIMQLSPETNSIFSKNLDVLSTFLKNGNLDLFKQGIEDLIKDLEVYENNEHYIKYLQALLMIETKEIRFGLQAEQIIDEFLNDFSYNQYYITPLEISLNIYYSIVLQLNGKVLDSIKILQNTYNRVINLPYSSIEKSHTIAVIAINISTCYYLQKKYKHAIDIINDTINYRELQFKIDDLFQLFFRKGLCLYQQKNIQYKVVLIIAFNLINTETYLDLYKLYKAHVLLEYNINIDDL